MVNPARRFFNLPESKFVVLFGAYGGSSDPRKGFDLLLRALEALGKDPELRGKVCLAAFGESASGSENWHGFEVRRIGMISDDATVAKLYAAASVFVAPSREDNLPNTIVEALACGTPCVAFRIGGMPDLIENDRTGYLAAPFDCGDLAYGIKRVLLSLDSRDVREGCRAVACEKFTVERQARDYSSLYLEVLASV